MNSVVESSRAGGGEGFELYRLSLFIMAGILVVGLVSNILIRPVAEKHFADRGMVADKRAQDREAASEAAETHQQTVAGGAGAVHRTVSIVLAVIVAGSLLYGLGETAVRAAALFLG